MPSLAALLPVALLSIAACAQPLIESTAFLEDTQNTIGPYTVESVIRGAHANDKVELFINTTDQSPDRYIPLRMQPLDSDGRAAHLFAADIPGQDAGTVIRYYVAIERDGVRVEEDPVGGDLNPYLLTIQPE